MTPETPRPWTQRLLAVVTRRAVWITAAVVVVLALAYTLAGFFLVPRLIAERVPRYVQEQLYLVLMWAVPVLAATTAIAVTLVAFA